MAADLGLPQHVLRFWETRFTQIRPMKRGGGRRYYRPDDIDLLRGIRSLLYGEGYTIRGVQRILKEQGPRFVIGAGRGEVPEGYEPNGDDADDEAALFAATEPDQDDRDAEDRDGHVEPTFDPREFRPRAPGGAQVNGHYVADDVEVDDNDGLDAENEPSGEDEDDEDVSQSDEVSAQLAPEDVRRLKSTLSELLELKRLLDRARD